MRVENGHVLERLGRDHISWCLDEPWEQLNHRIEQARSDGDQDLAWCYEQIVRLKGDCERLLGDG